MYRRLQQEHRHKHCTNEEHAFVLSPCSEASSQASQRHCAALVPERSGPKGGMLIQVKQNNSPQEKERERNVRILPSSQLNEGWGTQQGHSCQQSRGATHEHIESREQ